MALTYGSDVLFGRELLRGRTVGIVCNPASVDAQLQHVTSRAEASGVRLGAIFGPQHGLHSDLQENMIESPHARDDERRVPIYSLYSETREPTRGDARGPRRARDRSAGRRHADLHVHLHDGELPPRGPPRGPAGRRVRSAESDRRPPRRRPDARRGVPIVRRAVSDPDASRDDDRRAGAPLQRALRHRREARGRRDEGLVARAVLRTRPACRGCCRRRTSRPSKARSSTRER